MSNSGSSIPGSKPPAVVADRVPASFDTPAARLESMLDRPTAELVDEAGAVASAVVEDSKTVGGLGVNLMTVFALLAASPWSWIAMLLLGPARVWGFLYAGVVSVAGTAAGCVVAVLVLLVFVVVIIVGWFVFRSFSNLNPPAMRNPNRLKSRLTFITISILITASSQSTVVDKDFSTPSVHVY